MSIFLAGLDCYLPSISRTRHTRPMSIFLPTNWHNEHHTKRTRRARSTQNQSKHSETAITSTAELKNIFVNALVSAGQCRQHARPKYVTLCTSLPRHRSKPRSQIFSNTCATDTRQFSTKADARSPAEAVAAYEVSRDELNRLMDIYTDSPYEETKHGEQPRTWRFVDHVGEPPPEVVRKQFKNDPETLKIIKQLQKQVRVAHPDHEQVWQSYQSLPEPRAPRLPPYLLKQLFHHLSVVEHKSTKSMLRYFAVLEEARAASIPLTKYQWTSAISFAGRHAKRVSETDLEAALQLWRQMEHQAGVKGTSITFNVLFDIATKARKFALAEMIMKEMQARELPFTRFFRVSLIQFYGLKGDGDGVRYAYKQFVDAGEIVDSAVLTAVIKALLQCGEAVAADQIFARAKALHLEKTETNRVLPPAINWRQRRKLGRLLDSATRDRAEDAEFLKEVQAAAPLAPTLDTYRALIFHYAVEAGNLDRVTELLNEMKHWGVNMHGGLYMYLFHGFAKHGGVLYTAWTRRRLEQTWNAFTRGVEAEQGSWRSGPDSDEATSTKPRQAPMILRRMFDPNPSPSSALQAGRITFQAPAIFPTRALVLLVLRAFLKVAGPERTWDIWREAQEIWSPPDEDTKYIEEKLEEMLPDHDQSDKTTEEQIKGEIEGMLGHDEEDDDSKEIMNNNEGESWRDTSTR